MKKFLFFFLFLILLGSSSYYVGRKFFFEAPSEMSRLKDNGFFPVSHVHQQKDFVIIVCSANNGAFVEKTIRSIFSQVYDHYRLIYVDDASTDGSFAFAQEKIQMSGQSHRVTTIQQEQKQGYLACLIRAIKLCADHEIVVLIQGEDWLAHEWVLSRLNQYYANLDLWLTYSYSSEFPSYHHFLSRNYTELEWKNLRHSLFLPSPLFTFYTALFRQIRMEDLLCQNEVLPEALELAVLMPMLEMAEHHFQLIPEVFYVMNHKTTHSIDCDRRLQCERTVRCQKPYLPLSHIDLFQRLKEES